MSDLSEKVIFVQLLSQKVTRKLLKLIKRMVGSEQHEEDNIVNQCLSRLIQIGQERIVILLVLSDQEDVCVQDVDYIPAAYQLRLAGLTQLQVKLQVGSRTRTDVRGFVYLINKHLVCTARKLGMVTTRGLGNLMCNSIWTIHSTHNKLFITTSIGDSSKVPSHRTEVLCGGTFEEFPILVE